VNEEEKEQIRAWKRGMDEVNRYIRHENRVRPREERMRDVLALMASRDMFGRKHPPPRELTEEQLRWSRAVDAIRARDNA
jgi:hypothetical protein